MRTAILSAFLFALSGAAYAQPSSAEPQLIEIGLSNFKFRPSTINLQHGQGYRLHFVNRADGGHDFVAKTFFSQARIDPGDAAKVKGGRIELKGGQSTYVTLTPQTPGTYKVHCSHFMHSTFGMTGQIVVT